MSPASNRTPRTGVARVLSKFGFASRSRAAELVRAGRVAVNGARVLDPEFPVRMGQDTVSVDGEKIGAAARRYLLLNKPRGLVTTTSDERGRATVYSLLPPELHALAPVGRLDKASEGLLLFTNDTLLAQRLLDPATHLPKCYHVQIDRPPDGSLIAALCAGVVSEGELLRAHTAQALRSGEKRGWLEIVLHEGRNRQIRRMLAALDVDVLRLVRVAVGPLALGELAKGQWRELTGEEIAALAAAVGISERGDG